MHRKLNLKPLVELPEVEEQPAPVADQPLAG
jgi:hypothetical protein